MNYAPCGTAAQLRSAQALFDNAAPIDAPDDEISEADAPGLAAELIRSTPAAWSRWLQIECDADRATLCPFMLARVLRSGSRDLCVPELLALLMTCNTADLAQVRWQLVERFDAAHREQAEADAAEMLAEQERQRRRLREEAADRMPELWA